jgi:FkbM family methyltransferase
MLVRRNAWLKLERTVAERGDWLLLRERRIKQLEAEIKKREATVREREAKIRALEVEVDARTTQLHLLESALDQARDVLRKRDARLIFSQDRPAELPGPSCNDPHAAFRRSTDTPAEIIGYWRKRAAACLDQPAHDKMQGILADPYVIEKCLHGRPTRLLIPTRQSQQWYDRFDLTEAPFIEALMMVRPGDTVFDCGAHQGVHSIIYSRIVGLRGRVFAFEPFPINLEIAKLNAALNRCSNIDFIDVAVSSHAGQSRASEAEECIEIGNPDADDLVELKLAALDEFAHLKPSFIKIDVEGAEIDALEGADQVLRSQPCVYIEMHPGLLPRFGKSPMDVFKFFKPDEYLCFANYPGQETLSKYRKEFDLALPCALFFIPRSRPPLIRYYTTS